MKAFNSFSSQEQINVLMVLIEKYPGHVGSYYASLIFRSGFGNVDSSDVNRILYKHKEIFEPNLNEKKVPAWTLKIQNKVENKINKSSNLANKETNVDEKIYWSNFDLYDWQKRALKAWEENQNIGYCVASRKTGKSYLAKRISFIHCYTKGPVVVVVNTLDDIDIWFQDLNELKKQFGWEINIVRNDLTDQSEIERDSILVVTKYWLKKFPLIIDDTLIVFDNIELKEFKSENFSKIKYRFSVYISTPENKKVINYFERLLLEYSFTDAMLEDIIQEFSLKFSLLPITEVEKEKFDKLEKHIKSINTVENYDWVDYLSIRDNEESKQFPKQILIDDINELMNYSQRIKSKIDYFMRLVESFSNYEKIVVFCENPKVIQNMFGHLINNNIDYIVYSVHEDLHYISRSPHEWHSQKVLITDHIKFFSNFNFDYIDYVLIFGTLGNSSRLIQKLEAVFNTRKENKKLLIDILCAEGTVEDPYKYPRAYEVFKEYRSTLKMDTPVIKELKKKEVKSVENFIDLSRSKILVIYPKGDEDIYSLNELIMNVLNITDELIEYQEDISIDEILSKLRSGNYSDLYFESKLSQEQIKLLHQIYEFDHSIIIKIYQSNKLIKGRLIEFILNSQKYKFINQKGNVIS